MPARISRSFRETKLTKTLAACFTGNLVQAIVNNFAPLLFLTFQKSYAVPLSQITLLVTFNFGVQLLVDLLSAGFVDCLGYRRAAFLAHLFAAAGLLSLAILPGCFADPFVGLLIAVTLYAAGGGELRYIDVRRFGRFWYFQKNEPDELSGQSRLGPEPTDPVLTAEYLKAKLGGKRKTVKEALLDQSVVAGIGNIYADEILFAAGLHPAAACCALTDGDWQRLAEKIPEIILWGIDANEMTPAEYLAGKGRDYRNIAGLRTYGRAGQPCAVCGCPMEKTTVGGRTSCFCPHCQRKQG